MPRRSRSSDSHESPRRVTIHDVAASLGLSAATVSFAVNGKGTIAQATRQRVLAEAARLGYRAHPAARRLRGGRSGVLALSVRSLDSSQTYRPTGVDHFTRMAGAAAFTALDRGFGLMLVPNRGNDFAQEAPDWVDGYILEDPQRNDPIITRLIEVGVPVVTIGWDPARKSRTASVSTSDRQASLHVLDLLLARGAKRISFVSGVARNSWNYEAERAYREWCGRAGVPVRLLRFPEHDGERGGADAAAALLSGPERSDAVYCQTGRHAAGLAAAAQRMGLRIPDDLMVAAGADAEQTRNFDPPITAVDLQPEVLGRDAVELLADILAGADHTPSRTISARLIERASTAR